MRLSFGFLLSLIAAAVSIDYDMYLPAGMSETRPLVQGVAQVSTADEFKSGKAVQVGEPSPAFVQKADQDDPFGFKNVDPSQINITFLTQGGIVNAILLIVSGVLFTFWGYRSFKGVLFIIGFFILAYTAFIVLNSLEQQNPTIYGSNRVVIYIAVPVVAGLIGGFILKALFKVGVFITGAYLGFLLSNIVLGFIQDASPNARLGTQIGLALVGGLVALWMEKPILIVATSVIGAFDIAVGVDYWVQSGFTDVFGVLKSTGHLPALSQNTYIMLGGFVIVALLGMAVQFREEQLQHRKGVKYVPPMQKV